MHIAMKKMYIALISFLPLIYGCTQDNDPQWEEVPESAFSWCDVNVQLEDAESGWTLTRFNNAIALTDTKAYAQYILQWEGDCSDGVKKNVTMTVSQPGKDLSYPEISIFKVRQINGTHYEFTFVADGREGHIAFAM